MQQFKSRTLHCRNSFEFFSFVLIKKLLFNGVFRAVCYRARQVAMCRFCAGDCREVCRGNVTPAPVLSPAMPREPVS